MDLSLKMTVAESADVAAEIVQDTEDTYPSLRSCVTGSAEPLSDRNRNILPIRDMTSSAVLKNKPPISSPNHQGPLDLTTSS
jgi:hypothetical protein